VTASATVRPAATTDAAAIAAIYAHHVLHGTATYDTEPPPPALFAARIGAALAENWPFLVAECGRDIVGYGYASQFRERAAYAFTCEDSLYVRADAVGSGVGGRLLDGLVAAATTAGFRQMLAVIGGAEPASVRLHHSRGFREIGRVQAAGWKHGRWLDNVYMQRALGEGSSTTPPGPARAPAQ
jgi:phosphinothricin acetyltransferase